MYLSPLPIDLPDWRRRIVAAVASITPDMLTKKIVLKNSLIVNINLISEGNLNEILILGL